MATGSIALMGQVLRRAEVEGNAIVSVDTDTAFERGDIQHLVSVNFEQDNIQVKRGDIVTIPITVDHKSHSFWQWITVSNFQQVVKNYVGGKYVEVNIRNIAPASAIILPNSSVQMLMTFSIDESAPDEIVGKSITLGIQFDGDVAFGGSYLTHGNSINVEVTG